MLPSEELELGVFRFAESTGKASCGKLGPSWTKLERVMLVVLLCPILSGFPQ